MVVPIEPEPEFAVRTPTRLFEGPYLPNPIALGGANYDVSPDGQRFLMVMEDTPRRQINVVLNWSQELLERVPVD